VAASKGGNSTNIAHCGTALCQSHSLKPDFLDHCWLFHFPAFSSGTHALSLALSLSLSLSSLSLFLLIASPFLFLSPTSPALSLPAHVASQASGVLTSCASLPVLSHPLAYMCSHLGLARPCLSYQLIWFSSPCESIKFSLRLSTLCSLVMTISKEPATSEFAHLSS